MENSVVERIGLMYAPDFRFSRFSEGFFLGRTNSYGCLGKGAPRKREGDEIRILFLGDSFALGHTVFERHHFGRTIEQVVSAATGRPVTVLNFARADFALSNLHQHYIDFASQWDHDVALFFADHTDLDPRRHASRTFYPYASIQGDSLHYDYSFFGTSMARTYARWEPLLHRTVLPRFVFEFLKVEDRGDLPHLIFDKLLPGRMPTVAPPVPVAEADPMPEVTRLVLDALADEPQVVLVLSGPVHPDYEAVIHELGIPALDLNPVLARLEEGGIDPYWWTVTGERGHWNHKAHDAIGEALGHGLLDRLR